MAHPEGEPTNNAQGEPGQVTDPASTGGEPTQPVVTEPVVEAPYKEQLEALPESIRPLVEPIFKDWDANTGKKFDDYTQQLKEWEPWKDVAESYDPDTVQQALTLAQLMQSNPQQVYEALAQAYPQFVNGQGSSQQQQTTPEGTPAEVTEDTEPWQKEIKELKESIGGLAQYLQGQQSQTEMQQAQSQLDTVLKELKDTHGDFNEDFVLTLIASGAAPEVAVQKYKDAIGGALQQQQTPAAPTVVGGGGGQPTEAVDVTKMSDKETKDHVASLLAAAAANN